MDIELMDSISAFYCVIADYCLDHGHSSQMPYDHSQVARILQKTSEELERQSTRLSALHDASWKEVRAAYKPETLAIEQASDEGFFEGDALGPIRFYSTRVGWVQRYCPANNMLEQPASFQATVNNNWKGKLIAQLLLANQICHDWCREGLEHPKLEVSALWIDRIRRHHEEEFSKAKSQMKDIVQNVDMRKSRGSEHTRYLRFQALT